MIDARRPSWFDDAACAGAPDPRLWFPEGRNFALLEARGVAVCERCPVRVDCLMHAMNTGEEQGTWGGLTEVARRRLRAGRTRRFA